MIPTTKFLAAVVAVALGVSNARAQESDLYTHAPSPVRSQEETALPWLERLERDLAATRPDARRVHVRSIAQALVLAGDANSALQAAASASTDDWIAFVRSAVEDRLAANDVPTAIAICHVLERNRGQNADASRAELVRATALVGRDTWSQRAAGSHDELLERIPTWLLEGRIRRGPTADAMTALAELAAIDAELARRLTPVAAWRALHEGRVESCLALVGDNVAVSPGLRAELASALWRTGRREEALARLDVAASGPAAALLFADMVDVPSEVLDAQLELLARRDLEGRNQLGRAVAAALAREGDGREAWRRASQLGAMTPHERFELALELEDGGDEGRATTLAASDPWSAALLELRRACGGRGEFEAALSRARELARASTAMTLELCAVLTAHGRRATAGELAVAVISPSPAAIESDVLVRLVRVDIEATGGANLARLHAGLPSPAARLLLSCAAVEACLAAR